MRRFFILAAIWVGLLGPIDPLFACVVQAHLSDCCPTGTHDRSHHDSNPCGGFAASHECHAALAGPTDIAAVSARQADGDLPFDLAGGAGGVTLVPNAFPNPARPPPLILSAVLEQPAGSLSGTDTYLRTSRLRL
ncbi:MAG: hypothetical protein ABI885_07390 [Gammaproteobacteria bacterium]